MAMVVVSISPAAFAAGPDKAGQSVSSGPRKHLANIVFAGLAGAVLGLSTLSFYGRPQDRLSNIAVGFAIGVIGGTMYSTYKAAAEPREFYGLDPSRPQFDQLALNRVGVSSDLQLPLLGYQYSF
jgi:hypothetical protein